MLKQIYTIPDLPLSSVDLQTRPILLALNDASRSLADLNGRSLTIPNQEILINTLSLQEALASSRIENIVTTQDELFQVDISRDILDSSPSAKEVARYRDALMLGYSGMCSQGGIISSNLLIQIYQCLKRRDDGFRRTLGTVLRHDITGMDVYVPPQDPDIIIRHMVHLERFINDDEFCGLDPLIKMALIHHQFESIHPFHDGNGRVGRILNVLYLVRSGLLESPILYLSRSINQSKSQYYDLLQSVRDEGCWEDWVIYMLGAVSSASRVTVQLIIRIRDLMASFKKRMRSELPRLYSQDLLNNLFRHPYTRIDVVARDLGISPQTARNHLRALVQKGFLREYKKGRNNYYINYALVDLFLELSDDE